MSGADDRRQEARDILDELKPHAPIHVRKLKSYIVHLETTIDELRNPNRPSAKIVCRTTDILGEPNGSQGKV